MWATIRRIRHSDWLVPVILGVLVGLVMLLIVLLIRTPRDTAVLEVVPESQADTIQVWVGGEVANPGLYTVPRGSRVADAVTAAGGATDEGDVTGLGMAAPLEDADQIIVPRARSSDTAPAGTAASSGEAEPGGSGRINVNTATASELETLNGVGPVIAERIRAYRQANGPFQSVDELAQVSGISDRMVDEFGSSITVGR